MAGPPRKALSGVVPPLDIARGSWTNRRPEYVPEFGACNVTVALLGILTFPTIPAVPIVRMIVTPVPLALSQVEHLSPAFDWRVKSPSVIQYVPGKRST